MTNLSNTDAYIFIHLGMHVTYMYTCIHSALVNKLVPCTWFWAAL